MKIFHILRAYIEGLKELLLAYLEAQGGMSCRLCPKGYRKQKKRTLKESGGCAPESRGAACCVVCVKRDLGNMERGP